jgi:hypothetical protein
MCRFLSLIFLLLGLLASFDAAACHRISPVEPLDQYSAVFLGVVTGIRLDGYESRLLGRADGFIDGHPFTLTDGSSPVSVTTVAIDSVHGAPQSPLALRLVGCTTALPSLKERGLFFVSADGTTAVTVWESSPQEFIRWLKQLGIQPGGR